MSMLPRFHPRRRVRAWPPKRPFDPSLVAYYSGLPWSGSVLYDESLYGNHGSWPPTTWADGKIRPAPYFDGSDDILTVPYNAVLNPLEEITVSLWVNLKTNVPAGKWPGLIGNVVANRAWYLYLEPAPLQNKWVWSTYNAAGARIGLSGGTLTPGECIHIAGVYSKAEGKMTAYQNGLLTASKAQSGNMRQTTSDVLIGMQDNLYFNGVIDEVRIYARALSCAEILRIYLGLA